MGRDNINGQGSASISEDLRTESGSNNVSKNDADESSGNAVSQTPK